MVQFEIEIVAYKKCLNDKEIADDDNELIARIDMTVDASCMKNAIDIAKSLVNENKNYIIVAVINLEEASNHK